jgi:hypothetical protein
MLDTGGGAGTLRCTVSRTGVFAAIVDQEVEAVTMLMSQEPLPPPERVRSYGLIYAGRATSLGVLSHTYYTYT